jgi:hypothetical protein
MMLAMATALMYAGGGEGYATRRGGTAPPTRFIETEEVR